jgi:hypothetical protein
MATSINTAEIPVSIVASATAASYTVPSDRYAIVRGQVKTGGTLSIGGVVVLGSDTWAVITNSNNLFRTPGNLVIQSGVSATVFNGLMPVGGVTAVGHGGSGQPALVSDTTSQRIQSTNYGTLTNIGAGVFANDTARTSDTGTFKVPAGTVIVGTGDARYLIELYRIPGSAT